jgi:sugar O-acyltransferase (sialic acid O-acetyltransferase NeuD family)
LLDSNPDALNGKGFPYAVLGDPDNWIPGEDEVFLCGLGIPEVRMRICAGLEARGARFLTLIHPSALIGLGAEIGEGCIIAPNAVVSVNTKLCRFVVINVAAYIGHDVHIGEGTLISGHCDIMGYVTIGRCCLIGGSAAVLPGRAVGDHAVVGAGSVAVHDVPARMTVAGVPARGLAAKR